MSNQRKIIWNGTVPARPQSALGRELPQGPQATIRRRKKPGRHLPKALCSVAGIGCGCSYHGVHAPFLSRKSLVPKWPASFMGGQVFPQCSGLTLSN